MDTNNNISLFLDLFQFEKIMGLTLGFACILLVGQLIRYTTRRLEMIFDGYRLLLLQISTVLTFGLYILGSGALVYVVLQPTNEMLTAVGAAMGFALGFASQDIVGSVIAGIILLFDRPFQVGDRVEFGDVYGEITGIGLRAVRLNTLDDNQVTIPNSKFIKEAVSSGNAGSLDMMIVCNFHLALTVNIQKVKQILFEVVATSRFVHLKKPIKIVIEETCLANRLALKFTVKAYVFDVIYEKDFQTDIFERASQVLLTEKIQRPTLSGDAETIVLQGVSQSASQGTHLP